MPPSIILDYVDSFTDSKWEKEKQRYEEEEPLAKSKSWDEFLRLAISSEHLEGRGPNAKAVIREGSQVLSKTRLKPNSFMGFGDRQDPNLDLAIANLERRARSHAEKHHHGAKSSRYGHGDARDRGHSHEHRSGHRRSHHHRGEEEVPHGRGKRREIFVMQSHHLCCHQTDDEGAEPHRGSQLSQIAQPTRRPHMPSIYEEEVHRTPRQGSRYGPAPPQEYVIPPRPAIVITRPNPSSASRPRDHPPPPAPSAPSLGGSTLIGSGYSSYLHDSFYDGPRVARNGRDSMADGGSRAGSQGRQSGVGSGSHRSLNNGGSGAGESRSRTSGRVSGSGVGSGNHLPLPNWGSGGGESRSRTSGRASGSGN